MIATAYPSPPSSLMPYFGPKLAGQVLPVVTLPLQTQLPPPGDEGLASGPYWQRQLVGADCMGCVTGESMARAIADIRPVQLVGPQLGEGSAAGTAFAVIGGALALAALSLGVVVIGSRVIKDPVLAPVPRRRDRRRGR